MSRSRPDDGPNLAPARTEILRLRANMVERVLPFWSTEGFDAECDLFHERFDFGGRPVVEAPRRAMVQARQIYVFSHAALSGILPRGASLVERALRTLLRRYGEGGDGGFAFSIHPDGAIHAPVRDSYTQAFVLFALTWAYRLTGAASIRRVVDRTLAFMDRCLLDETHGGLFDRHPGPASRKSQNPQMHYLEALLTLHESFPDGPYLCRATTVVALFEGKILRRDPGLIPEVFGSDWSDHPDPDTQGVFEPGHHFEWIWLLDWYDRLTGAATSGAAPLLWRNAIDRGMGRGGLILDEVGFDPRPRKLTHRLWPHTEAAKAAAVRLAVGDGEAAEVAAAALRVLNDVFLGRPFPGGWVDRVGPDNEALLDTVPASSLYHVYCAWVEAGRVFETTRAVSS